MTVSKEPLVSAMVAESSPTAPAVPAPSIKFRLMGSTLFDPKTGERIKQFFINGRTIGRPRALAEPLSAHNNAGAEFAVVGVEKEVPKDVWNSFTAAMMRQHPSARYQEERNGRKLRLLAVMVPCMVAWIGVTELIRRMHHFQDHDDDDAYNWMLIYTGLLFGAMGLGCFYRFERRANQVSRQETLVDYQHILERHRPSFEAHGWTLRLEVEGGVQEAFDSVSLNDPEAFLVLELVSDSPQKSGSGRIV